MPMRKRIVDRRTSIVERRSAKIQIASNNASGARFGRIRMATLEARPAASAAVSDSPKAKKIAVAQNAAAGTSLIGDTSIASTAGLVASSHDAPRPYQGD